MMTEQRKPKLAATVRTGAGQGRRIEIYVKNPSRTFLTFCLNNEGASRK